MNPTKPSRALRGARHILWSVLLLAGSAHAGDLRDPSAWEILVPHSRPVDCVLWQDLVVIGDDGGGLLLYDPSTDDMDNWTTREGLTSNLVTSVDVDEGGNLWVGTRGGSVVRFDPAGSAALVTGLLSGDVTDLAADENYVYYGTLSGAGRIADGVAEQVFQADYGLPSDQVRHVTAHAGVAWFGTPNGVARFDRQLNQLETVNDGLGLDREVLDLRSSDLGTYVSTPDGVFEWQTDQWSALATPPRTIRRLVLLEDHVLGISASNTAWDHDPLEDTWIPRALNLVNHRYDITDGAGDLQVAGAVEASDGKVYFASALLDSSLIRDDPQTTVWTSGQTDPPTLRGLFGANLSGMASDLAGGAWFGAAPVFYGVTHWRADGSVVVYALEDEDLSDGQDLGWMPKQKIAVLQDSQGYVWVSSYQVGVTRMRPSSNEDPATSQYLHLRPENSPFRSKLVVDIAEDPDGNLWFASDGAMAGGVVYSGLDILLGDRRDEPMNPASWVHVAAAADSSQLAGPAVVAVDFRRSGEAWISIKGFGLQRWQYDAGTGSGTIEPSALNDPAQWVLLNSIFGADLGAPKGVVFTSDDQAWLATEDFGIYRFGPVSLFPFLDDVEHISGGAIGQSLLSNRVRSVALDGEGAVWAASDVGLDRVTETPDGLQVDHFLDLPTFQTGGFGTNPDLLSPLPGASVKRLVFTPASSRLYLATQTGAARIRVDQLAPETGSELSFQVYPNPVRTGDTGVVVAGFEGEAVVEIYNLLGILLARRTEAVSGDQIWDTRNVQGDPVASGIYIVRLQTALGSARRPVAIER